MERYEPDLGTPRPADPETFDCRSVYVSLADAGDIPRFARTLSQDEQVNIYGQSFKGELGHVTYSTLSVRAEDSGSSSLAGTVLHTHPVLNTAIFATEFIMPLIRRHGLTGNAITLQENGIVSDITNITTEFSTISICSSKGFNPTGDHAGASKRGAVTLKLDLTEQTGAKQIKEFIHLWGNAMDILSTSPLAMRGKHQKPAVMIDLQRLHVDLPTIDVMTVLEEYVEQAAESDITVPAVDFDTLDLGGIAAEIENDLDLLRAGLAACAMAARRTYGATGYMPSLSMDMLLELIRSAKRSSK